MTTRENGYPKFSYETDRTTDNVCGVSGDLVL